MTMGCARSGLPRLRGRVDRKSIQGSYAGERAAPDGCGAIDEDELHRLARLALSTADTRGAVWRVGRARSAWRARLALLHQDGLWQVLDGWLRELAPEEFLEMLPLLRRAFADFTGPERRQMGEKVQHLECPAGSGLSGEGDLAPINRARADLVLPILAQYSWREVT